ncbi:MAG: thiamine pyrophosphate-dependent enzyme [Nitrososphaerales archaeon]
MPNAIVTGGEAFLDAFDSFGVRAIFASPGSEQPPIWEALAKRRADGNEKPQYVNCRHELLAVSAAWTFGHLTRSLPVVIMHTSQGLLNGSMGIRGAYRSKEPMVIIAGGSSSFGEGKFDPGGQWSGGLADEKGPSHVAAPFVKWIGEIHSPETLEGTLRHACKVALAPPMGPTFVFVPYEFLMENVTLNSMGKFMSSFATAPDHQLVLEVSRLVRESKKPLIITESSGHSLETFKLLIEFAESYSIPVVEAQTPDYANFPRNHPLHQGFDAEPYLKDSDLVILIDAESPWHPTSKWPLRDAKVVLIDDDPVKSRMPYFDYRIDVIVSGSLEKTLHELVKVAKQDSPDIKKLVSDRLSTNEKAHNKTRADLDLKAQEYSNKKPMNSNWVAYVLGKVIPDDALIIEEAVSNRAYLNRYLPRSQPLSLFSADVGGLGTGFGFALGAKLATKDRLIVAVMGDGAFNYGPVSPSLGFVQEYKTPFLLVLLNNGGYAAQYRHVVNLFPNGYNAKAGMIYGPRITPSPDYVKLVEAFDGCGIRVEEPSELERALKQAIQKVRNGQMTMVDVIMEECGASNWKKTEL